MKSFPGGDGGGVTPVPISNTEVKPSSADGTALETRWESRKLPGFCSEAPVNPGASLCCVPGMARLPLDGLAGPLVEVTGERKRTGK